MGLDWCVGVYKNEEDWKKGDSIDPSNLSDELKSLLGTRKYKDIDVEVIPSFRGKVVASIFYCVGNEEISNMCFGIDHEFEDEDKSVAPFLTDDDVDDIITVLKKVKEMDDVEEEAYEDDWESWEEICQECDNAIDWLERIQKANTMGIICKVHCWY